MDRLLPWLRRSGWAYVAAAIALVLVAWRIGGGGGGGQPAAGAPAAAAVATTPGEEGRTTAAAPSGPAGFVHVAGAVRRPGVYRVPPGTRVVQAIARAGGATPKADLAALNLAATVQDGQQVLVPRRAPAGVAGVAGGGGAEGGAAAGPISLSSATAEDLDALDGIGPTLAGRIVEWRRSHGGFSSVDQLLEVPGIGPTRLESLRARVVP
jgi:competence protein ComEA